MPTLVLFATRYGSTGEYAREVSRALGCPALQVPDEGTGERFEPLLASASRVVLGAPIYGPSVLPAMERFCALHRELLTDKELAAFVVCGDTVWIPRAGEGGTANLRKLTSLLPRPPVAAAVWGGRMRMEELDGRDRPAIEAFYRRLGREATGFDRMDPSAAYAWGRRLLDPGG